MTETASDISPAPPDQAQPAKARVCRPKNLWQRVLWVFLDVLETQPCRLLEEASWLAVQADSRDEMAWYLSKLHGLDPIRALTLFRQISPDLHLHSLNALDDEQKYSIAVGLLRFFTSDDDAYAHEEGEDRPDEDPDKIVNLLTYRGRHSSSLQ